MKLIIPMTNKNFTSRWWIIDAINFIQEQIALASHCQELIHYYESKINETTDREVQQLHLLNRWIQQQILDSAMQARRTMMKVIQEKYKGNHLYRCQLKHAIAAYQFATEVMYANVDCWEFTRMQSMAYENMIGVLSLFTNQEEFVTCWRCLDDMLYSKKDNNDDTE